ncbi:hypothetical protein CFP56_019547 [Quercus suber]|uniref:Uncharacterized protein n=1 Tax=Quercus suber TaxID=58331 RepID=A0AAW0KJB2_QUESU
MSFKSAGTKDKVVWQPYIEDTIEKLAQYYLIMGCEIWRPVIPPFEIQWRQDCSSSASQVKQIVGRAGQEEAAIQTDSQQPCI